jgi:SnoaL-like protein
MLSFNQTDLGQTFQAAIDLFNAADYDTLAQLFHDNVEMKQVDDVVVVRTKEGVRTYLNTTQTQKQPQFVTTDQLMADGGVTGIISGYGQYADAKGTAFKPVLYCFVFLRDANRNWLLRLGFAALLQ